MVTKTWGYLEVLTSSDLNTTFAECATLTGTETLTNKKIQFQAAAATPEANTMVNEAIVKAWGRTTGGGALLNSYNIDSMSVIGTGHYRFTLKKAFANSNYIVIACAEASASGAFATVEIMSSSTFDIYAKDSPTGNVVTNYVYFICIGAQ
jgi:hypothetical protein